MSTSAGLRLRNSGEVSAAETLACLAQILDWLPQAILVCDGECRVVILNRSAREILAAADRLLIDEDNRLAAREPERAQALAALLAAVARPRSAARPAEPAVFTVGGGGRQRRGELDSTSCSCRSGRCGRAASSSLLF